MWFRQIDRIAVQFYLSTMALASPCIGVCRLDPAQRYCTGCGRTLREIGDWPEASEARQREILAAAAPRAAAALAGDSLPQITDTTPLDTRECEARPRMENRLRRG
ncbi:hypothetical protein A3711_09895 [Erythrobacter sp. HI00D59]|nr:hypothetical protein A3711_09895 [Erythrobacter sp. HI00D59]